MLRGEGMSGIEFFPSDFGMIQSNQEWPTEDTPRLPPSLFTLFLDNFLTLAWIKARQMPPCPDGLILDDLTDRQEFYRIGGIDYAATWNASNWKPMTLADWERHLRRAEQEWDDL